MFYVQEGFIQRKTDVHILSAFSMCLNKITIYVNHML